MLKEILSEGAITKFVAFFKMKICKNYQIAIIFLKNDASSIKLINKSVSKCNRRLLFMVSLLFNLVENYS